MDKLDRLGTRNQANTNDQEPIKTGSFGGLNTVTPLLNLPFEDSPYLQNTTSGLSGSMSKRLGTKIAYSLDGPVGGFSAATVRTNLGHYYVVAKQAQDLKVYETTAGATALVMTKANVWNSDASNERAATAVTNEPFPRIFFCTGKNTPVQLRIAENATTTSGAGTSFTVQDPGSIYKFGTTANVLLYKNGTRVLPGYSVSWAANVLTIGSLSAYVSGDRFDVVLLTWQWVAESFYYKGYDLYYPTTKFHIDNTDQNVIIPEQIRDNVFTLNSTRVYPFYVQKSPTWNDVFTLATSFNPTTDTEYHFGSGAIHTPGNVIRVAPNYVTFGAIKPPVSAPEEVHILRGRLLPFNGGSGATGANIAVYLNGVLQTQSTNTAAAVPTSYYLRDNTGAVNTSTATIGHHITFDSTANVGLVFSDEVLIINKEVKDIGSGASADVDAFKDGALTPFFGIGLFSYYGFQFHPSAVATYQGRLVFSGWAHDPMHVAASEVWDALVPGQNFINFDIPRNEGLASEPIDVQVTSYADDFIVNILEFQFSLFVFTRQAVHQIKPTQGALSATGVTLSKVANIGLINARALEVVENTVFFLSDSGVYDLTPTLETGDYLAGERTIKVRNLIAKNLTETNKETAFLSYNKVTSEVYLGFPNKSDSITASRLYVYSVLRDSWFEYTTPSGFNLWGATAIIDTTLGKGFLLWCTTKYASNLPNNLVALVTDNVDYYLDFVTTATGTGASQNIPIPPAKTTTITTTNSQHEYKPTFPFTPFPEVEDLVVTLNGAQLTFLDDWVKRVNGTIYLLENPGASKTLFMRPKRPINNDDIGELNNGTADYNTPVVIVNNVTKQEGVDYTVGSDGSITLTAPSGSSIKVGLAYLTIFSTPLFSQGTLSRFKRLIHFYAYLNNTEGLENFTGTDVVGAQNPDEIVDRPKKELGVNVAIAYDSGFSSELTFDLYEFSSLVWDFGFFDTPTPVQDKPYRLFKEPILGVGYGFQVYFYNWDERFFDLVGWQVDGKLKGRFNER